MPSAVPPSGAGRAGRGPGEPALALAGSTQPGRIKKSRNARLRAAVLIAVHLLIAAHVAQFMIQGRTISPVEPSESMYTLELGEVNAGFVFLLAAMVATLIFGRFFCGWGCHLVAVQDFCGWIMKKLHVKPQPFRSRWLMWVPAAAAFYMFFWPTLKRWGTVAADRAGLLATLDRGDWLAPLRELGLFAGAAASFPGFSNHLVTDSLWKTFPGPVWAVLTFATCGFVAVYLLGAKGFCTYACPYGALFGGMDRWTPGRIVVSDACEQCGHCTATCTSNVIVHEEVRRYGMVVDPGCMKCMDCVSVCPKGALSYGFAKPSMFKGPPADSRAVKRFNLDRGEEIMLFAVWLFATISLRGLYGKFPLLMSIGLGAVTAFMALKLWQLLRRPTVRLQNLKLKLAGKLRTSGWIFAGLSVVWLAFTVDAGFLQWHSKWGQYHLNRTEARKAEVLSGAFVDREYSERHYRAAKDSFAHYQAADRPWRLQQVDTKLGLAWGYLLQDDRAAAKREIHAAVELAPERVGLHDELIEFLAARGEFDEALAAAAFKMEAIDGSALDHVKLAGLLMRAGERERAADELAAARELAETEGDAEIFRTLGTAYLMLGKSAIASDLLDRAVALEPGNAQVRFTLAGLFVQLGRSEDAIAQYRACIELAPTAAEPHYNLGALLRRIGRPDEAIAVLEAAQGFAADDLPTVIELGLAYAAVGRDLEALDTLRRAAETHAGSPQAQFQLPSLIDELERRVAKETGH